MWVFLNIPKTIIILHMKFLRILALAVLPAPHKDKLFSTFIYSSKIKVSNNDLKKFIRKNFSQSHGLIHFEKKINSFQVSPHLSYPINKNFFYCWVIF